MNMIQSNEDIRDMARGAVFMGAGGGGDPYIGELFLQNQLTEGRSPKVIPASELKDDDFVISIAGIGAPTVLVEYLVSEACLLELLVQVEKFFGKKVDAIISAEIGGANSMFPLALGARSGIPVIDGDGMGRAFPHLEMTTFSVYGARVSPMVLIDEFGNVVTMDLLNDRLAEEAIRPVVSALGAMAFSGIYPMSGAFVKEHAVHGTITETLEIGRCIRRGREESEDVFGELLGFLNRPEAGRHAHVIFDGKIVDVTHETRDGWHWGTVKLKPIDNGPDEFVLEVQNEYIVGTLNGETKTVVPDLICVLDRESGEPMTAEMLRYGLRVKVIGYSAAPVMRKAEGLKVWGPRCFGLKEDFQPVEALL